MAFTGGDFFMLIWADDGVMLPHSQLPTGRIGRGQLAAEVELGGKGELDENKCGSVD
jgi:hypothetical protein